MLQKWLPGLHLNLELESYMVAGAVIWYRVALLMYRPLTKTGGGTLGNPRPTLESVRKSLWKSDGGGATVFGDFRTSRLLLEK